MCLLWDLVLPCGEYVACIDDVWRYGFDGGFLLKALPDVFQFFAGGGPNHEYVGAWDVAEAPVENGIWVMFLQLFSE